MDLFSFRKRFFQKKDDTLTLYPVGELAKNIARVFISLFLRVQYLVVSLFLSLVTALFVPAYKLNALRNLHAQDLSDGIKSE